MCWATLAIVAMTGPDLLAGASHASSGQAFDSPDAAIEELVKSARGGSASDILNVLGSDASKIVNSGDQAADKNAVDRFLKAFDEAHRTEKVTPDHDVLIIGKDDFPFPIPLVRKDGLWHFDVAAGEKEILGRRIGANELHAITTMHAYVEAQREYAADDRDGKGEQYARKLLSSEGKHDGLFWPAAEGEDESPLGPLIAEARDEGYAPKTGSSSPYHGYIFRILRAQGEHAGGGALDYVLAGRMIGGFALIATPAEYGTSGVMTFIVNQDDQVFQKDLGPHTHALAAEIDEFDPDQSWTRVDDAKP